MITGWAIGKTGRRDRDMSYRVNSKIFETEEEARAFSRDLQAYGGLGGWSETDEKATHRYRGDLCTEPIEAREPLPYAEYQEIIETELPNAPLQDINRYTKDCFCKRLTREETLKEIRK